MNAVRNGFAQKNEWLLWCVAIIVGTLDVWLLVGWREINPLNLSWLWGDSAQYEVAWEFLRHEPTWTFPPTWISGLDYPSGTSASNLDFIPLVGLLLRPFSPLLPQNFQYLGLWAVSCYVLQTYFGLKLVSLFAKGDRVVTLLGAMFFVLSPILTLRLYGHFPHSTQWIILAAIYLYFRRRPTQKDLRRYFVPFIALSALAAAITPYMALMVIFIGVAALGRAYLEDSKTTGTSLADGERRSSFYSYVRWILPLFAATFLSLLVFGFFVLGHTQLAGGGYPEYSLNLLSPFNPDGDALYFKTLPTISGPQAFEGYNYLGMGVLLLLLVMVAREPRRLRDLASPALMPLTIMSVILTVLALSVRVTFANHVLFTVPLPDFVVTFLSAFRASGRLFWPVYYLLTLAAITGALITVPSATARRILLAAALLVQYFDTLYLRDAIASAAEIAHLSPLVASDWQQIQRNNRHLVILPALQCGQSPGGIEAWPYFARLAARGGMTLNSAYLARISSETLAVDCKSAPAEIAKEGLRANTAYVLDTRTVIDVVIKKQPRWHYCRRVDGFNLCTFDPARAALSQRFGDQLLPPYVLGTAFHADQAPPASMLMDGWDMRPSVAIWSISERPVIYIRPILPVSGDLRLEMVLGGNGALLTAQHRLQRAIVQVDGKPIGTLEFAFGGANRERSIVIPRQLLHNRQMIEIGFALPDATTPEKLGINRDPRLLGIYVSRIRVVAAQ